VKADGGADIKRSQQQQMLVVSKQRLIAKIVLRMPTIAQASTAANSHNGVLVSAKLLTQRWMCSFHSVCVCVGRRRGVEEEEEEEEAIATPIQKMCAVEEQMDKNGPG
jgi:hypothetical protein